MEQSINMMISTLANTRKENKVGPGRPVQYHFTLPTKGQPNANPAKEYLCNTEIRIKFTHNSHNNIEGREQIHRTYMKLRQHGTIIKLKVHANLRWQKKAI